MATFFIDFCFISQ